MSVLPRLLQKTQASYAKELDTYESASGGTAYRIMLENTRTLYLCVAHAAKADAFGSEDGLLARHAKLTRKRKYIQVANYDKRTGSRVLRVSATERVLVPTDIFEFAHERVEQWQAQIRAENVQSADPEAFPSGAPITWSKKQWQLAPKWLALNPTQTLALLRALPLTPELLPMFRCILALTRYPYGQTLRDIFGASPPHWRYISETHAAQVRNSSFFTSLRVESLEDFRAWAPVVDVAAAATRHEFLFQHLLAHERTPRDWDGFFDEIFQWGVGTRHPSLDELRAAIAPLRAFGSTALENLITFGLLAPGTWDHYLPLLRR